MHWNRLIFLNMRIQSAKGRLIWCLVFQKLWINVLEHRAMSTDESPPEHLEGGALHDYIDFVPTGFSVNLFTLPLHKLKVILRLY